MNIPLLHNNRGFTMVELMIVVAIVGILAGLVAPNYSTIIAERNVAAETKRMIGLLKLARSEARARGATVTLSRSAAADWSGVVTVYESTVLAGNAAYTAGNALAGDDLIKNESATSRGVTVRDDAVTDGQFISFNLRGWLSSGETSEVLIAVCSPVTGTGNYIEINRVGKIRERPIVASDSGGCL